MLEKERKRMNEHLQIETSENNRPTDRSDERMSEQSSKCVCANEYFAMSFLFDTQQQHQKFNRINMYCVDFILVVFFPILSFILSFFRSFFTSRLICVRSFDYYYFFLLLLAIHWQFTMQMTFRMEKHLLVQAVY